jgi:hypothetical protein
MLSDVTISFGSQSISVPGLYLLIGTLIVLGAAGFVVAIVSSRRVERKANETSDILVVQLERIGDALDRLTSQNAALVAAETGRPRERAALPDWNIPGRSVVPPARGATDPAGRVQKVAVSKDSPATAEPVASEEKAAEQQPVESSVSEPARTILFSMLGR